MRNSAMTRSEAKPAFAAVNKLFREEPGWTARDRSRCDAGVAGSRDDRRARGRERRARGRLAQLPLRLLHPHPRHPGRQARAARAAGPAAFPGRGGRIEKPAPRVSQAAVGHPLTCAISIAVFSDFNGLRQVHRTRYSLSSPNLYDSVQYLRTGYLRNVPKEATFPSCCQENVGFPERGFFPSLSRKGMPPARRG